MVWASARGFRFAGFAKLLRAQVRGCAREERKGGAVGVRRRMYPWYPDS